MSFTPASGIANYLDNQQQAAEQAQLDALFAQQQAAALAQQREQETAAYEQQLQTAVAQQQAALNDFIAEQERVKREAEAAAQAAAAATSANAATPNGPSFGKYADMFANDMMENPAKYAEGTHGFSADNASFWNRKALDKWLEVRGAEMKWNSLQRDTIRKQILEAFKGSDHKLQVEERGWAAFVGDTANKVLDGAFGGLAELAAAGVAHSIQGLKRLDITDGINNTDIDAYIVDAVQAGRKAFGKLRSVESQDAELARQQAQGFAETIEAMKDNPSALTDEVASMLGMLFGAKGAGAAVKAGGQKLAAQGVTRGIAAGGAPSAASIRVAGLTDDVLKASAASVQRSAFGRTVGAVQRGVGRAADKVGSVVANPLISMSAIEAASVNNDVLRAPGAYDPNTHLYSNDALATGAIAGATNAAITYGFGRLFGTVEGAASRWLNPTKAANLGNTALGRTVVAGSVTLDDAIGVVTKEMSTGSSRAAADILAQTQRYITSAEGKQAMLSAVTPKTTMETLLKMGKTVSGSMLAEGMEEGLVGFVTSVALQGIGDDGTFTASRIDFDKAFAAAGSSAALGGVLGIVGGGMRLAQDYQHDKQVLARTSAAYEQYVKQVEDLQKTNMSMALEEAYQENTLRDRQAVVDGLLAATASMPDARVEAALRIQGDAPAFVYDDVLGTYVPTTSNVDISRLDALIRPAAAVAAAERINNYNPAQPPVGTDDSVLMNAAANIENLVYRQPQYQERRDVPDLTQDVIDALSANVEQATSVYSEPTAPTATAYFVDKLRTAVDKVAQGGNSYTVRNVPDPLVPLHKLNASGIKSMTLVEALAAAETEFSGFGDIQAAVKQYYNFGASLPKELRGTLETAAIYDHALSAIRADGLLNEAQKQEVIASMNNMLAVSYDQTFVNKLNRLRKWVALKQKGVVDNARALEQRYRTLANTKTKFEAVKDVADLLDRAKADPALRQEVEQFFAPFGKNARAALLRYMGYRVFAMQSDTIVPNEAAQDLAALEANAREQVLNFYTQGKARQSYEEASASTDEVIDAAALLSGRLLEASMFNDTVGQGATVEEVKKLGLTRSEVIDASESAAVKDTSLAIAEANLKGIQTFSRSSRIPAWVNNTYTEQVFAVQQQTIKRATAAIEKAFGKEIAAKVVFVSPNSQSLADNNANAYVLQGDLNTVYVVARPDTTDTQFVYHVAHELWHQHSDVMVRGKILKWGDYEQTMNHFASNAFVQELMGAMRSTYPELNQYLLAEEALAEIHAARSTKGGWDILRNRWGITTDVPSVLRANSHVSLINKTLAWFRAAIAKLLGRTRGASDAELAAFFRVVSGRKPTDVGTIRTPEQAQLYKARMQFEAAQARVQHYHHYARQFNQDFDTLPREAQQQMLVNMAKQNGDTLTEQELGLKVSYSTDGAALPQTIHGSPAAVAPNGVVTSAPAAAVAPNFNIPTSTQALAQANVAHQLVRQTLIYPSRDTASHNPAELDTHVGVISLVRNGNNTEVQVHMNDVANGVVGHGANPLHTISQFGDINEAMHDAFMWLHNTYPHLKYEQRHGTTFDQRAGTELTPHEIIILNRANQLSISSPSVRRWTAWLRNKLPNQYLPVLDKFLDFVELMRVRWVDRLTPLRNIEAMYEQATGNRPNVIARLTRDMAESSAFIHRSFNRGLASMATGKQSLRDRVDAVWEVMQNEHVGQERINKFLYGLEEAVRYNLHINSTKDSGLWELDSNGKRYLVDATNTATPRKTVTGFRFAGLDTLAPNKGEYDLGGRRFLQALAALPVEERNSIGRIVAEISATGRVVGDLQRARGVITQSDHALAMYRGTKELEAAFPELAAQGVDFGGFFMTMRDDNTSAFKGNKESRGRGSAVQDVLKNTAEKWQADVAKAFRNNELANFALMVMSMPNKYFAVEPVTPRTNPDDPTGAPIWENSDKGALSSTVVFINGVPVKLVAKSESAKLLFDEKAAHPGIAKVGAVNHFFNQFKTSLNPGYVVFGLLRDIMTGYLNINGAIGTQYVSDQDAARIGVKTLGYALKYLFAPDNENLFASTWRGQYGAWAEAYQRKGAGMQFGDDLNTGAFEVLRRNELLKGVRPAVDMLGTLKTETVSKAARIAETIAYPPETAMRLGAFRAYTEHLFGSQLPANPTAEQIVTLFDQVKNPQNSDKAAAIIAGTKNLTSNFQQHGTDATVRNLFSFHNAVMQGTFSTLPQIFSTAHGRRTAMLIMLAAVAAAVVNIGDDETDEFGNSKYFQNRNRNRVIILGDDLQIPVSDEIGWIKNLADNIVGVAMNKRNVIDASTDQLQAMSHMMTSTKWGETDNSFINAMYAVTPTLGQPLIALSTGYDIFGRKLQQDFPKDANGKSIPFAADVERTTHRATDTGAGIAEFLYGATSGAVDMTGDEVDAIGIGYFAGLYRAFARTQTETMLEHDGLSGMVAQFGSEYLRPLTPMKIDTRSGDEWKRLGERIGVSMRHEGGILDVLDSKQNASVAKAQRIYNQAESKARKAKSNMGLTYKQIDDMIERAEASGRYADARDLRADRMTIRTNADAIRMEALAEIRAMGVQ